MHKILSKIRRLALCWLPVRFKTELKFFLFKHRFEFFRIQENLYFVRYKRTGLGFFYPFSRISASCWTQLDILSNYSAGSISYLDKYVFGNFKIPSEWCVIDCGAFIGRFTIDLVKSGHKGPVYCIEPSLKNFVALQWNLQLYAGHKNIESHQIALGEINGVLDFNLSNSGENSSLLYVDDTKDDLNLNQPVVVQTLSKFVIENGIDGKCCFLKLEAEGYEPEILYGMQDFRPAVISVDVSPERNSESSFPQVQSKLFDLGYSLLGIRNN